MPRLRAITLALAAAATAAAVAGGAYAMVAPQEGNPMEAWIKAGTPGPQHAMLAKMVGEWTAVSEMSMAPGAPPTKTPATATHTAIFGGRFVTTSYKSTFMGQPFEGRGTWGYDNTAKEYHSHWLDSMGTMALVQRGAAGDDPKVISVSGSYVDPMSGKTKTARNVITVHDDDSHTMEMFEKTGDGDEVKTITIRYTRKK